MGGPERGNGRPRGDISARWTKANARIWPSRISVILDPPRPLFAQVTRVSPIAAAPGVPASIPMPAGPTSLARSTRDAHRRSGSEASDAFDIYPMTHHHFETVALFAR